MAPVPHPDPFLGIDFPSHPHLQYKYIGTVCSCIFSSGSVIFFFAVCCIFPNSDDVCLFSCCSGLSTYIPLRFPCLVSVHRCVCLHVCSRFVCAFLESMCSIRFHSLFLIFSYLPHVLTCSRATRHCHGRCFLTFMCVWRCLLSSISLSFVIPGLVKCIHIPLRPFILLGLTLLCFSMCGCIHSDLPAG